MFSDVWEEDGGSKLWQLMFLLIILMLIRKYFLSHFSGGMNGYMYISGEPVQPAEIYSPIEEMEMILNNEVLYVHVSASRVK